MGFIRRPRHNVIKWASDRRIKIGKNLARGRIRSRNVFINILAESIINMDRILRRLKKVADVSNIIGKKELFRGRFGI